MGISWHDFWNMNPRILKAHIKGYEERQKHEDYMAWLAGQYTMSAVQVVVEHAVAGNKAKSKYVEKPFLESANNTQSNDVEKQRELFVAQLLAMKANFDNNKNEG